MNFFSFYDIINSLLLSSVFGIALGGIYSSFEAIIKGLYSLTVMPIRVLIGRTRSEIINELRKENSKTSRTVILQAVYDFFFFVAAGILYVIVCYIALDGVFRLYMLLASLSFFLLSNKTLGKAFNLAIRFLFVTTSQILFPCLFALAYPIRLLFSVLKAPILKLCSKAKHCIGVSRANRIKKKKIKEMGVFIKKCLRTI